jgi:hypothetical protein
MGYIEGKRLRKCKVLKLSQWFTYLLVYETRKKSHFHFFARLTRLVRRTFIYAKASLVLHPILAKRLRKRVPLSTLLETSRDAVCMSYTKSGTNCVQETPKENKSSQEERI